MPGMDSAGPLGSGPIGRGLGPCGGGTAVGGRGNGFSHCGGTGWRNLPTQLSPEDEKTRLERDETWLQTLLESVKQRLEELNK